MSNLVIEHLHVYYGKTHAVDDLSLHVEHGELCVFLGPSGCGKTSTLRSIAGLVRPDAGRIILDGQLINDLYPGERDIGMVFQSYALYPHMTVRQHLEFPLRAHRMPRAEINARMREMSDQLDIAGLLDRYPFELSGGEAQRVAIGRALIRQPKLWLLDEPLTGLDPRLSMHTRAVLKRLQKDLGITTIYVTHDQEEAQSLADKIVIMDRGRIQQVGTSTQVYHAPINLFVAGFVGTPPMNFTHCTLDSTMGRLALRGDGFELALDNQVERRVGSKLEPGQGLILGVRPEAIQLTTDLAGADAQGRIEVVEPQGSERIVSIRIGNDLVWKARIDKHGAGVPLEPQRTVGLHIVREQLHLFDRESEVCLI